MEYLVYGTNTELERVRVIYRWITAQDLSVLEDTVSSSSKSKSSKPETVIDYLIGLKNESLSYHRMMADMCR